MPKVTQYGEQQTQTQIVQGAQAQSYRLASNNPQAVESLKQGINEFQLIQQRAAKAEAEQTLIQFEKEKNAILFDPEKGYFNTQGRDAFDNAETTRKSLAELRNKYTSAMSSDEGKKMFGQVADVHVNRADVDVMRHASQGLNAWEMGNIKARADNSIENATLYWNDSERLNVQREIGRQAVMEAAKRQGISGDALNENLQTFESAFSKSVVLAAMGKSSKDGQEAMQKYESTLEGPDLVTLRDRLEKKTTEEKTQEVANQAVNTSTSLIAKYGDAANARGIVLDEINKIEDPELRKSTMREAMTQLNFRLEAKQEEQVKNYDKSLKYVINGGSVGQLKAQNPSLWNSLSGAQQKALSNMHEDGPPKTNFTLFSNLMLLPESDLAKVNPADYADKLSQGDLGKLLTAVKSARKPDDGGKEKTDQQVGRTRTQQIKDMVDRVYGPEKKRNDVTHKQVDSFYTVITDEVKAQEERKGSPLTSREFTDMLNDVTRTQVEKGWLWDSKREIKDIPAEEFQKRSDTLIKSGIPVTSANIRTMDAITGIPPDRLEQVKNRLTLNGVDITPENIRKAYKQAGGK